MNYPIVLHGYSADEILVWVVTDKVGQLRKTKVHLICSGAEINKGKVEINNAEIGEPFDPPTIVNIGAVSFPIKEGMRGSSDCSLVVSIGEKRLQPIRFLIPK